MSARPKIFIGSSSEGYEIAEILFSYLGDDFRPFLWKHGLFVPGRTTIEELERAVAEHDFAVLCATPDDALIKRGETHKTMRDNVLFELGLFMGKLGRKRTFLLVPRGADLAIPTDLYGLIRVEYDAIRFALGDADKLAALQTAAIPLRTAISKGWSEIRSEQERSMREALAKARGKSIQKIFSVIVQLRDLLIELPGEVLTALGDQEQFNRIKRETNQKLQGLADAFRDDAATAGVTPEFDELVNATREAVLALPYPEEMMVTEKEIKQAALEQIANAISEGVSGRNPAESFRRAVESEIQRRTNAIAEKYPLWWNNSEKLLRRATSRLHAALMRAALEVGQRQLPS